MVAYSYFNEQTQRWTSRVQHVEGIPEGVRLVVPNGLIRDIRLYGHRDTEEDFRIGIVGGEIPFQHDFEGLVANIRGIPIYISRSNDPQPNRPIIIATAMEPERMIPAEEGEHIDGFEVNQDRRLNFEPNAVIQDDEVPHVFGPLNAQPTNTEPPEGWPQANENVLRDLEAAVREIRGEEEPEVQEEQRRYPWGREGAFTATTNMDIPAGTPVRLDNQVVGRVVSVTPTEDGNAVATIQRNDGRVFMGVDPAYRVNAEIGEDARIHIDNQGPYMVAGSITREFQNGHDPFGINQRGEETEQQSRRRIRDTYRAEIEHQNMGFTPFREVSIVPIPPNPEARIERVAERVVQNDENLFPGIQTSLNNLRERVENEQWLGESDAQFRERLARQRDEENANE